MSEKGTKDQQVGAGKESGVAHYEVVEALGATLISWIIEATRSGVIVWQDDKGARFRASLEPLGIPDIVVCVTKGRLPDFLVCRSHEDIYRFPYEPVDCDRANVILLATTVRKALAGDVYHRDGIQGVLETVLHKVPPVPLEVTPTAGELLAEAKRLDAQQ